MPSQTQNKENRSGKSKQQHNNRSGGRNAEELMVDRNPDAERQQQPC